MGSETDDAINNLLRFDLGPSIRAARPLRGGLTLPHRHNYIPPHDAHAVREAGHERTGEQKGVKQKGVRKGSQKGVRSSNVASPRRTFGVSSLLSSRW